MMACLAWMAGLGAIGQIAAWDFYGQSLPATCSATMFNPNLVTATGGADITRGPGAPASGGLHSFRTTGFQNNGISPANTDYFQITLQPLPGYKLSLTSIDAKFNGTSTFYASPGVTSQFAYSLDGANFFLIGAPSVSTSLTMPQVILSGIPDLQNVYAPTVVTIRYYASGQTTTGGWGFYSASAGTNGLAIGGVVAPAGFLPPTIHSPVAGTITSSSAILGGHITGDGGNPLTARGTVWSTLSPVTLSDHPLSEGGTDTGHFSHLRSGLPAGTRVFHAAYAINPTGSTLSQEASFYTLSIAPVAHVSAFTATAAGTGSVALTWEPPPVTPDGYLILMAPGNTAPAGIPADATMYTAGNSLGNGTVVALLNNGNTATATITALAPGTTFTFSIFPFHWDGSNAATINYLTDPATPSSTATTALPAMPVYTWIGVISNDFTHPGNWSPARVTPSVSDILVFDNGITITLINVPPQTIGQIKVTGNTSITLQGGGTLAIAGMPGTDLLIAPGSQLNASGSAALHFSLGSNSTADIFGSMTLTGAGHRLLAADTGSVVFQPGGQFKAGSGFTGNPFGTVSLHSVVFDSGSVYVCEAGGNPFGATAPASVVVFRPGSLYRIDAYAVPSLAGRTYGNFEMNYPGMITVTGNAAVSIGNFTASRGWFYFNLTGNPGHSIKGNIHVASVATLVFSPSVAGTVNLNGTSPQVISGTGALLTGQNSTLVISNSTGVTFSTYDAELNHVNVTDNGIFTVSPGSAVMISGNLTY